MLLLFAAAGVWGQPLILTRELPKAVVNQLYSQALSITGGTAPYTVSATQQLPGGLSLSSSGVISGTANRVEMDFIDFQVRDARGATGEARIGLSAVRGNLNFDTYMLPPARLNESYDEPIPVSGGVPPYRFTTDVPGFFSGLALTPNGRVSGVSMEQTGFVLKKVQVEDAAGSAAVAYIGLVLSQGAPLIRGGAFPQAIMGGAYRQPVPVDALGQNYRVTPGFGPSLPPGMRIEDDRFLAGTPLAAGRYRFHLYANVQGFTTIGFAAFTIQVVAPFRLVSATSFDVGVGATFQSGIEVEGFAGPFRYEVVRGALPAGIQLQGSAFTGVATQVGTFNATVRITDSQGRSAESEFVFRVADLRLQFSLAGVVQPVTLYQGYRLQTAASGGRPPYGYSIQSGTLLTGLSLNAATGEVTGVPVFPGVAELVLRVRDSVGATQDLALTLSAAAARRLAGGEVGRPYNLSVREFFAARGVAGLSNFSLRGEGVAGLSLSREGMLNGAPQMQGEFGIVVAGVDGAGRPYEAACNLYVAPAVRQIQPSVLPGGVVGRRYRQSLSGVGLSGAVRWSVSQGLLPAGLTLNAASGVVEGTPASVSAGPVVIEVTDGNGVVRSSYYLVVTEAGTPQIDFVGSAASYDAAGIAPGELLTVFGSELGPGALTTFTVQNGVVPNRLAGVRVLIQSESAVAAPVLYVSNGQMSLIAPFQIPVFDPFRIVVENGGKQSAPLTVLPRFAKPAFFTSDGSGRGQIAALNEDGSVNSMGNPARAGSIVVAFLTGIGPMTPAGRDGLIAATTSAPQAASSATVNGARAELLYLGNAPGLVQGVAQANLRLPAGARLGENPVVIVVGGNASSGLATVWVKE
jgi:uncharacterized protein (TIGR03437 family)